VDIVLVLRDVTEHQRAEEIRTRLVALVESERTPSSAGTGFVSCNSVFVLHLCCFLNQEELMEREAMVQNP
jgi:hypothetical protein